MHLHIDLENLFIQNSEEIIIIIEGLTLHYYLFQDSFWLGLVTISRENLM